MKTKHFFFAASLLAISIANAAINIETVLVDDAGNPNDPGPILGQVNYNYRIGIYEVTNAQYAAFLNSVATTDAHGLYNTNMGSTIYGGISRSGTSGSYTYSTIAGRENNPVNYVNFFDAARFANWLTNGQPTGAQDLSTTETGMYFLNGVTSPVNTSVTRLLDFSAGQNGVAVSSVDEWYKAGHYSGSPTGAGGGGYWRFAYQSNDPFPTAAESNHSNNVGNVTPVGSYGLTSYYGTFDQTGNVREWNDEMFIPSARGLTGGSFSSSPFYSPLADVFPSMERQDVGFRVTSLEPITETNEVVPVFGLPWLVLLIASMLGLGYRKIR